MTDVNDFVQELMASSDRAVGTSFFAMVYLDEILEMCFHLLHVCCDIIYIYITAVDLVANKNLQMPSSAFALWDIDDEISSSSAQSYIDDSDQIRVKFKILCDGYQRMFDRSLSKSKHLGVMLKFLPGVVVQKQMSMQGMAILYRIKPDFLKHLIKFTIKPLKPSPSYYVLDDYLSRFLQDRDRSQLHYCDPILQHISICRHFLSLLARDRSDAFWW